MPAPAPITGQARMRIESRYYQTAASLSAIRSLPSFECATIATGTSSYDDLQAHENLRSSWNGCRSSCLQSPKFFRVQALESVETYRRPWPYRT